MRSRFRQNKEEIPKEKVLDVDATMQGTMLFKDPVNLKINGRFEGNLNTKGTLMIGEHASVSAEIDGEYITIAGKVRGSIKASKELKIIAPGRVEGDLETPVLSIAEGAIINGKIKMANFPKPEADSAAETLDIDEVAKYLEIDTRLVSEWAENGKLPARKEGGRWKVEKQALENWVSNEKVG